MTGQRFIAKGMYDGWLVELRIDVFDREGTAARPVEYEAVVAHGSSAEVVQGDARTVADAVLDIEDKLDVCGAPRRLNLQVVNDIRARVNEGCGMRFVLR